MAEEQDWKSLSTINKIEHKNWNARVEGYKEALKEMNNARDAKDPLFNQYLGLMKKMVVDNNVVAQEKALEVVLYFVEESNAAGKVAGDISTGLVAKCFSATRQLTRERAIEIMKMLIEIEKHEIVLDELLKGLTNKTPKIVVGCITVLKESLREFGPKIIPIKELFKTLPQLLEDRDKGVRDAGKELIIEIYRWIGKQAMTPQLSNFKPVQVTELNVEFEKLPTDKPAPSRYLRSQKPKVVPQAKAAGGANGGTENVPVTAAGDFVVDPYDYIVAVEVISKVPTDFYDKIEDKKWTNRKEVLDVIDNLTNHEKLVPGDFGELIKVLLKVLSKDSNVVLVVLATKILYQIAHGIRKKYSPYAVLTIQACLEKFKEKKANVVKSLRDCIDAAFVSTTLDAISEDAFNALAHKTPSVRSETCMFLNRIFEKSTMETLPKKHLKTFIPNLVKLAQDSAPEVREASFQAIGTAMMVVSEKHIKPFTESIDSVKMARIMEFFEKAKTDASQSVKTNVVAPPPVTTATEPAKDNKTVTTKKTVPKKAPASTAVQKPTKKAAGNVAEPELPTERVLSDEDVSMKAIELFGETFMNQIVDKNFKERLAAVEILQQFITNKSSTEIPSQLIVKLVLLKPGLKDNNFQALKAKFELLKDVVMNGKFTWTVAEQCILDICDKIGDIKNGDIVKSTLTEMSDVLNLHCVASQVIKATTESVNIKNVTEAIVWISDAIKDFGLRVDMKELLPFLKLGLQHTNQNVRQVALKLVGTISLFARDSILILLKDEKSSVKQLIDQEIEAMKSVPVPVPTRGLKNAKPVVADDDEADGKSTPVQIEIDQDELIPRENISDKITDDILNQLADKSLKIKKEGFDAVIKITDKCSGIFAEGLQSLVTAVAKNTGDSSKVISKIAMTVLDSLCKLFTKKDADKFVKIVVPALLACCSDSKPKNREDAVATLNTWVGKVGFASVADGGMIVEALKVENPFQKAEILSWLSPHLTTLSANKMFKKSLPSDFSSEMLPCLYLCLEERNSEVRKNAQDAVLPFMLVFGYDEMMKSNNKSTKATSKDNVKSFLDKAKEQLPVPDVSASKSSGKPIGTNSASNDTAVKKPDDKSVAKVKKEDAKRMSKGKNTTKEPEPTKPEEGAPLLQKVSNRKQRLLEDSKKKNLTKPEISQLINTQFAAICGQELMNNLFHNDFKKHIVALEMLSRFVADEDEYAVDATKQNLDLILKWIVIRFDETNPSVVNKGLEYLSLLFTILIKDENFSLHPQEANNFLPDFILKLGDANANIRMNVVKILKLILNCYQPKNVVQFIERILFETKVAKVKQGCSEFVQLLIDEEKIKLAEHSSLLISVSKLIAERDSNIRNAALNCLVSAHNYMGDSLLKLLKELVEKESDMLKERIKRIGKAVIPTPAGAGGAHASTTTIVKSSRDLPLSKETAQFKSSNVTVNQTAQVKTPLVEVNPILREEVSLKLINVDEDIKELLQPLEKITLRFTGRVSQTVNSNDAITAVIHSINSIDVQTSIQAMAQIDEVIKNQDVRPQLLTYMDNLVMSITMQLKSTLGKLSEEHFIESEITDMFKGMLASLMSIFSHSDLAAELNRDRLMNLVQVMLRLVINDQLVALTEGCTIIRGINILSVRILESSNQTRMLSSLLRMMMDCLRTNDSTSKYLQLIFKCIWSMTKNLTATVNTIDLVIILRDIHTFYTDFPPHVWEANHQDVPMRTVKTIVYSIINHKRSGVLEALYQIPNTPGKELDQYIRKSYAKLHYPIPTVLPTPVETKETTPSVRSTDTFKHTVKSNSRPYLEELKEIFQKIGNPSENNDGLNDLFDFKIKNPDVDLSRYLNQTTTFFQRTIENGLKKISTERGQPLLSTNTVNTGATAAVATAACDESGTVCYGDMDPDTLLRRLKDLRIKAGLDKPGAEVSPPPSASSVKDDMEVSVIGNLPAIGSGQPAQGAPTQARRMSATDLNAFRQRINFYKNPR